MTKIDVHAKLLIKKIGENQRKINIGSFYFLNKHYMILFPRLVL